ncbi:50S ribosomal protein L9, partial [Patescibacteria group bacterium]|nr:50S ribosomal protein L9 [Patescibacteria group bacterium]
AKEMAEKLSNVGLVFKKKAKEGKLYGSITEKDIVDSLKKDEKVEISKDMVKIKSPIKTIGEHKVKLELTEGVTVTIGVKVEAE